jgi:hypothetical protein
VVRSVAERYAVAAFAFMAAATWLGVGLTSGFACLFVFVMASQVVRLYQRRSGARSRGISSSRERRPRSQPASAEERSAFQTAPGRDRSRPSGRLYDGGREEFGRPAPSESAW